MTLADIIRLMPATPMADSRPPMVVGIRQTSSATSTVALTTLPVPLMATANSEYGLRVTITNRNSRVRPTRRMVRATSLGVFCRRADSTMEIMRSRKDSPGLTLMRTTNQSDSTLVPPVTEEKSPPASRITGADSPVMALSSTVATPSMTSPSRGTRSPASISTTMSLRNSLAAMGSQAAPCRGCCSNLARVWRFMPLRLAAWARLRPSARASAKLANNTVNHNHRAMLRMKPLGASPCPPRDCSHSKVVSRLPR